MDLKQHIRSIPDFPKPGILFYDISTLLAHPDAWQTTVQLLSEALRPHQPDMLVGIESRGFLVAAPLATSPGSAAAFTVILSVAVDVKGRPPGPLPASSMRTGNVPGLGGVHCSNVTVRRCRGKRTPRLFVATILFSTFSVPRTSLNMWSKGFVTVKARLTGCGPEGAEAAVMAWDVEDMVPCGPVPPPLVGALVPPVPPIVVVPEAVPLMA